LRPNTYEVLYNLGTALYNLNRLDEARQALQQAGTLNPEQPEVFYRLGQIASARGESENALGLFAASSKAAPGLSGSPLPDG
jgi:Flp pilus assembly protein TadD, contains TPR repeats